MSVKDFLIQNWRLILEVALVVISVVLLIVKKKPVNVVDTIKEIIVRILPALINQAEMIVGLSGQDKLRLVLDALSKVLKDDGFGDDVIKSYLPFAQEQVEIILSTPTKKGAFTREK